MVAIGPLPGDEKHVPKRDHQAVDVVVVGAGAIGLACAWRAAQRGPDASACSSATAPGAGRLGRRRRDAGAGRRGDLGRGGACWAWRSHSHAAWPAFAAELAEASGADVGYLPLRRASRRPRPRRGGGASPPPRADALAGPRRERGCAPAEARGLEPGLTPRCAAAVHAPHEAAVDPGALVAARWPRAAERAGVEVIAGAEVAEALIDGGRDRRGADRGRARASAPRHVVLASGSWSGRAEWLPPERAAAGAARQGRDPDPARPPSGRPASGSSSPSACTSCPRPTAEWSSARPSRSGASTLRSPPAASTSCFARPTALLPDVAELELVGARGGLRPGTPDNAPLVGPGAVDGLFLATGHYRNGILLAPATADAVSPPSPATGRTRRWPRPTRPASRRQRRCPDDDRAERGRGRASRGRVAGRRGRRRRRRPAESRGVAAAVDGEVVPRAEWERHALVEGAGVEVVRAVQGG